MKRFSVLFVLSVLSVASIHAARPGASSPIQLRGGETPEQIQAAYTKAISGLAPNLAQADGAPLRAFEAALHHAARPGAEAERAACCKAIADALQASAPAEAKAWMLKLVAFADRGEVVPVAIQLLAGQDLLVRESARYALQHNPLPEAADALRAALAKTTDPDWQAALVLALGARKDAASVKVIANLGHKNEASTEAILSALGNVPGPEAAKELAGSFLTVPAQLRVTAAEFYLKLAERLLTEGRTTEAAAIYRMLNRPLPPRPAQTDDNSENVFARLSWQPPRSIRLAALKGLLQCAGDDAAGPMLEHLAGNDPDARAIAAGHMAELSSVATKKLATSLGKLPTETQVLLLAALADRGEKSALPEALTASKSADESVRLAGLSALGRFGDASTVPTLVEAMQTGGNSGTAAKDSLQKLDGAGVNDAVIAAMQKQTDPSRRAELLGVIESRGASAAVPVLLQELAGDNSAVRAAAFRALGKLAAPDQAPALIQALLKTSPGNERTDAERAVVSVCLRAPDADRQSAPVTAAYATAGTEGRAVLLPVLGRLGGTKAFEFVKSALAGNDAALQKAGEDALMNWPGADDAVEAELLSLAQRSQKPGERTAALRAYIRVIAMPSGLPERTRLAKFQKAMDLADRDQEKNFVLERLAEVKHLESFRLAAKCLDQPALAARAGNTICDLAKERGLRDRNQAEFESTLNKIVAVCKDQAVVDRAKRRLSEK